MDTQELKNFLTDSPPSTVNLVIKKHFEALTDQQARYAHYISRCVLPNLEIQSCKSTWILSNTQTRRPVN
jgi:dipeptidyl-peptidase-3